MAVPSASRSTLSHNELRFELPIQNALKAVVAIPFYVLNFLKRYLGATLITVSIKIIISIC